MKTYYVYIMASASGTTYVGMTNNLERRVHEHISGIGSKFAAKYHCHKLVYTEQYRDVRQAIRRETEIKGWRRAKKDRLIESANPDWENLLTTNYLPH